MKLASDRRSRSSDGRAQVRAAEDCQAGGPVTEGPTGEFGPATEGRTGEVGPATEVAPSKLASWPKDAPVKQARPGVDAGCVWLTSRTMPRHLQCEKSASSPNSKPAKFIWSLGAGEKSMPAKVTRTSLLAGSRRHAFHASLPFAARARKKA